MSSCFPSSWAVAEFGELIRVQGGSQPPKSEFLFEPKEGYVQLLQIRDFGNKPVPTYVSRDSVSKFCEKEDILIARYGASLGRILTGKAGAYNVALAKAIFDRHSLDSRFVFYYLHTSYFQHPLAMMSRSAQNGFSEGELKNFVLPLPPLNEQRRIVAKIEEVFSELGQGIENWKQARAQLAVYRQALLKHAFEGKLTADWRETHTDQLESADQLFARIRAEREVRYQSDLLAWSTRGGNSAITKESERPAKPRKPILPFRLDSHDIASFPPLPSGWEWMTLESLASPAQRSIQSGPFGSSLRHDEFSDSGILVIGIDNVRTGYFSRGSENRIPPATFARLRKYAARPNDVLITVMATVGRCCCVPVDLEPAIITKHVYRISPNLGLVTSSFLVNALIGSPVTVKAIEKDKIGQTRPGINGDILKWLPIPLPPLDEQREITRRVTAIMDTANAVEVDIEANLQKAEALRQSILKKAFCGELVPQDPNDEPAAALLARIRAERAAAAPDSKRTRQAKEPCPAA